MRKYVIALPLFLISSFALAQEVQNSSEATTQVQNTTITSTILGTAQDWSLTSDEWAQYLKFMQGPMGKWYPQLTPAGVLGIHAKNLQEQKHFAEIVAKEEHDKLARELNFNNAVHQALQRLYPNEPVIKPFDLSNFNPAPEKNKNTISLQAGDHLVLFTNPIQSIDFLMVPKLINTLQKNLGTILDVYCLGDGDDNAIRSWAKFNHIPLPLVSEGRITLNHDNGQLKKMAGNAELPYVVLVRNGQSQPLSTWSLS